MKTTGSLLFFLAALAGWIPAHGDTATLFNLETEGSALVDALKAQPFDIASGDPAAPSFAGKLIVWEAKGRPLSPENAAALGAFVQQGGSLLMGFDLRPGVAPVQLNFLSPTTGWSTQGGAVGRDAAGRGDTGGEIGTGHGDPDMFGQADLPEVVLPYHFVIQPFSAVERGIARFDCLEGENPFIKTARKPGDYFWTRPLLNRDWKIRLRATDRAASPLLLTGRYGAGRVAVFASGLDTADAGLAKIWAPVLRWLSETTPSDPNEPSANAAQFTTTVIPPAAGHEEDTGGLHVEVTSTADHPLALQVIGRVLTWEGSPVEDVVKPVQVPAGGTASVDLSLPATGPLQYQALQWRRAFVVRVGLLSNSGETLLAEKSVPADLSPSTGVGLYTDNLYQIPYPYPDAPGQNTPGAIRTRMGAPISAYAYPPGQTVKAVVVLTNGLHDLAPLSTAADETTADNISVISLTNNASVAEKKPRDKTNAYGCWIGKPHEENVLSFHFAAPVTLAGITLDGDPSDYRQYSSHNPASVAVECDGKKVAGAEDLDTRFVAENGSVHVMFDPVQVTDVKIRMPWTEALPNGKKRLEPWLGHMELLGSVGPLPAAVKGDATLILRNSMTGEETVVAKNNVTVPPGGRVVWPQAVVLPEGSGHFYQLEALFNGQKTDVPILAIQPERTLISIDEVRPPDAPSLNFIVTSGFRNCFPLGTGTREAPSSWEEPDDLVWCYSHRAKQVGIHSRTMANWLYLSESDMRHYSDPWIDFPNGEAIMSEAAPNLVNRMKKEPQWAASKKAILGFGDRWDSGPSTGSQYEWQEFVAFDEYLRARGEPGLKGTTRAELGDEIEQKYAGECSAWQDHGYVQAVAGLHDAFAAEGKDLVWGGQGIPFTSTATAEKVSQTVRGMSDDDTWGMEEDSIPWTTARQLVLLAYNPEWKVSMNFVWGWDSAILGNLAFYAVPATTEPSRRHYYDSTWRGLIGPDGQYHSSLTYGYGANGGVGWVTAANDWQQMWRAQERFSLIYPDAPLGAGFIVSSSIVDSPDSTLFSGGGMGGAPSADATIFRGTKVLGRLHDCGLSIPFTSNILSLRQWKGTAPLVLLDLSQVTDPEIEVLKGLAGRGVKIAAFAGGGPLPAAAAALFGVKPDGTADVAKPAGTVAGTTLLAHGNCLYVPLVADAMTLPVAQQVTDILRPWLSIPITFPEGTMGYGFVSGKQKCVVLEDWLEKGRVATVRIHADGAQAKAIELNDHRPLDVQRNGDDWLVQVPLRPGDGEVVVLQEGK